MKSSKGGIRIARFYTAYSVLLHACFSGEVGLRHATVLSSINEGKSEIVFIFTICPGLCKFRIIELCIDIFIKSCHFQLSFVHSSSHMIGTP